MFYWAHMLDECFNKQMLLEGKHWPEDYVKTGINLVKASSLGQQSWYSNSYIQQDIKTFASEFEPLSHKNSNLGFFSTIVKWFITYSGTSKEKYQEFIERKLDGIIGTLQTILNDPSYDKMRDEIKQRWTFSQFEELQKKMSDEAKASSDEKMKNIVRRDDYEVIPIYSYEELHEKFGGDLTGWHGESEWCHTNGKSTYESWTKNGTQMFFVLAKKGWQKVSQPEQKPAGKDYNAYDEYGLSLIAILVDVATGNLLNETLRWNHIIDPSYVNPGASVDKAFKNNWGDLSQAVGMDVKAACEKELKSLKQKLEKEAAEANKQVEEILKNVDEIDIDTIPKRLKPYLVNIDIPSNVTSIRKFAFSSCTNLTSVTISDSVTDIGDDAFANCESLMNVTIPNSVTSIGKNAFYGCSGLTNVTIPNSVMSIGERAFMYCQSLMSVTIPNNVTDIGHNAFAYCTSLMSAMIGNGVTRIKFDVFENCTRLTNVTIPNSVTSIEEDAFYNCIRLKSVTIPNSVTSIGYGAFENCSALTSVTIPDSVMDIKYHGFFNCNNLKNMTFQGKTLEEVKSMSYYPWGIKDESIIKADDELNESKHDRLIQYWAHMLDECFHKDVPSDS